MNAIIGRSCDRMIEGFTVLPLPVPMPCLKITDVRCFSAPSNLLPFLSKMLVVDLAIAVDA